MSHFEKFIHNQKLLTAIVIALVICYAILSILVAHHPVPNLDVKISLWVQKYHTAWLDQLMLAISFFGELPYSLLLVLLISGIFFKLKYKREAYFLLLILLSGLLILGLKNIIDRPRPTAFYVRLVEINRFHSFPSGHVMSYLIFFGFLIVLMQKLPNVPRVLRNTIIAFSAFLICTIPLSRVYLGAHWFSDTLGGLILGFVCLLPLCYFYFKRNGDKAEAPSPLSN